MSRYHFSFLLMFDWLKNPSEDETLTPVANDNTRPLIANDNSASPTIQKIRARTNASTTALIRFRGETGVFSSFLDRLLRALNIRGETTASAAADVAALAQARARRAMEVAESQKVSQCQ